MPQRLTRIPTPLCYHIGLLTASAKRAANLFIGFQLADHAELANRGQIAGTKRSLIQVDVIGISHS